MRINLLQLLIRFEGHAQLDVAFRSGDLGLERGEGVHREKDMAKESDPETVEIIELCRSLGFVVSELSGGVLIQMPMWTEFKSTLPATGALDDVKAYHRVKEFLEARSGKLTRANGRWKVWHTGTVGIDGFMSGSQILNKELRKPLEKRRPTTRDPWIL